MDLGAVILSLAGPALSAGVAVLLTIRSERRARERERAAAEERERARERAAAEAREREREAAEERMTELLQTMVVEKIDGALAAIKQHETRISQTERTQAHLQGFLQGKGCVIPDFCPADGPEPGGTPS